MVDRTVRAFKRTSRQELACGRHIERQVATISLQRLLHHIRKRSLKTEIGRVVGSRLLNLSFGAVLFNRRDGEGDVPRCKSR